MRTHLASLAPGLPETTALRWVVLFAYIAAFLAIGLKPVTAAKILSDKGGEGIAVLFKGTGVSRDFLPVLWTGLKRSLETEDGSLDPDFARVAEIYEIMTVAKAQTTLRYWNWSLSTAYSPSALASTMEDEPANEDSNFSSPQRTARLVFGR